MFIPCIQDVEKQLEQVKSENLHLAQELESQLQEVSIVSQVARISAFFFNKIKGKGGFEK